jgi:uncharacterized protein YqhQ
MTPALWLQFLTTKEPDLDQIEVALAALDLALEGEAATGWTKGGGK